MKTKMKIMMAIRIWIVIYPSITLFLFLFGGVLSPLPLYLRTLILTLSLVPWMVFGGLPLLDKVMQAVGIKKK
ncbi:MAG: hypothetical protein K0S53_2624 [Bacteroidetes bacterium]|jgi:antibiotic biosynthesis monooxygenase (ABM) superfamily enzyme|nr:hypothetical protein [Bacteroidota bacterium]